MKRRTSLLCLIAFSAISLNLSAGEIHKWQDEDGRIHYGDRPPLTIKTETLAVQPNVYTSPSLEPLTGDFAASTGSGGGAASQSVVLYSTQWCGYCRKARKHFAKNGIPYTEYDVETSAKGKRDYKRLKARGVPVILVGKKRMNGFGAQAFDNLYQGR